MRRFPPEPLVVPISDLERTEQVIERRRFIRLTLHDQELLVKSLLEDGVEEPPPYVKGIAQEYAAKVISE